MRKKAFPLVMIGVILVLLAGAVFSASQDHYYVTQETKVIWDKRMPDHFPDKAYIHVDNGVEKFMVTIDSSTPGPLDLTILSPNGQTVYDYYSMDEGRHDLGTVIDTKKYGFGKYLVKIYQAHTTNIGYLITVKGPRAIGLDDFGPGCTGTPGSCH